MKRSKFSVQTSIPRITLVAEIEPHTGFGQHAISIVQGLAQLGIHVSVRPLKFVSEYHGMRVPTDVIQRVVSGPQPEPWELVLARPNHMPTPGKRTAYFTMFEATRLDPKWVRLLNMAEVVIVPSQWQASTFSAAGVTVPIRIVPLGVDPDVFKSVPLASSGKFKFGAGGKISGGSEERKGMRDVVDAFVAAFSYDPDVSMEIKLTPDCQLEVPENSRITLIREAWTDKRMAEWFQSLDAFVSASRCEGWGMMQHQAAMCGRPVVCPLYAGLMEFLVPACWPVNFTLENAAGVYSGHGLWAQPIFESLVKQMTKVSRRNSNLCLMSRLATASCNHLTTKYATERLVDVLGEFGALQSSPVELKSPPSIKDYGVMCYLPPPMVGHAGIFLRNLHDHPPMCEVVFLQDAGPFSRPLPNSVSIASPITWFTKSDNIASYVFLNALHVAKERGWKFLIWLETDCRVSGLAWDQTIMAQINDDPFMVAAGNMATFGAYRMDEGGRREMSLIASRFPVHRTSSTSARQQSVLQHVETAETFTPFVNGAPAIYNVERTLSLLGLAHDPVKTVEGGYKIQDLDIGRIAVRKYGQAQAIRMFQHLPCIMATAGETTYPFALRSKVLREGTCVAVHQIKNRWIPPPREGYSFYHSGDLGDIIYALKAISLLGGGKLILGTKNNSRWPCRQPITPMVFAELAPLLRSQPYITAVEYAQECPENVSHDLNYFRDRLNEMRAKDPKAVNLAEAHCVQVGVEQLFTPDQWMNVERSALATPILIHRSLRCHATDFPWRDILRLFEGQIAFTGSEEEYQAFIGEFGGHVLYMRYLSHLDLAKLIANAKWFIGNQSFPCALAIALRKNVYQETWPDSPDCVFGSPNFYNQRHSIDVIKL